MTWRRRCAWAFAAVASSAAGVTLSWMTWTGLHAATGSAGLVVVEGWAATAAFVGAGVALHRAAARPDRDRFLDVVSLLRSDPAALRARFRHPSHRDVRRTHRADLDAWASSLADDDDFAAALAAFRQEQER